MLGVQEPQGAAGSRKQMDSYCSAQGRTLGLLRFWLRSGLLYDLEQVTSLSASTASSVKLD